MYESSEQSIVIEYLSWRVDNRWFASSLLKYLTPKSLTSKVNGDGASGVAPGCVFEKAHNGILTSVLSLTHWPVWLLF